MFLHFVFVSYFFLSSSCEKVAILLRISSDFAHRFFSTFIRSIASQIELEHRIYHIEMILTGNKTYSKLNKTVALPPKRKRKLSWRDKELKPYVFFLFTAINDTKIIELMLN